MAIQQRSKILGSVQRRNERYLVQDVRDIITELNSAGEEGGIGGSAYVYVKANGNPIENATELQTQYAIAKTMTSQTNTYSYAVSSVVENAGVYTVLFTNPSNLYEFSFGTNNVIINNIPYTIIVTAISSSFGMQFTGLPSGVSFTSIAKVVTENVKVSLVLAPGQYDFQQQNFVIDDSLVNVVSLTGNADVILLTNQMIITANNILVKGIDVFEGTIKIGSSLNQLVVEKCKGGLYSFSTINFYENLSSTFNDCVGGFSSFGNTGMNMSGTFNNCIGGNSSFSPFQGSLNGTFNNCIGGDSSFAPSQGSLSGVFNNCVAKSSSFGTVSGNTFLGGTFNNCVAMFNSFISSGNYGLFNNCQAQNSSYFLSYGDPTFYNCQGQYRSFNCSSYNTFQGTYIGCSGGPESFGSNFAVNVNAIFINCSAEFSSFAGGTDCVFGGTAINCNAQPGSFGGNSSSSISTRITGKIINSQILGSNFLGSSFFGTNGELAGCWDTTGFIASRTM
jgi:hypothetical protein